MSKRLESYDEQTRTMTWVIEYNFRGKHIPQGILEDRFNDTQHLVAGTLEVRDRETARF
ncbi:hypothetical protein QNH46_11455 [Paenibacillus woosongensis]|uniref:Uncharacterized protein n=1 Tax=Paenibacillus woosongensis TaxID=307580 RepID=A0AA95I7I7_9BACL|nr:hypothetical protein [Paenibacillus woosongensis]WHX51210.1 hypothetical protein QNH46_11455 [Paenibacillus woosongensis]